MTTTRSGRGSGSPKSEPVQIKLQETSPPKLNKKRSAKNSSSPPAKRGRKGNKEQKTIEQSMEGIENDEDVEKQINGNGKDESLSKEKDMKETKNDKEKKSNGRKGEKNAFDEVKSDDKDEKRVAKEEQDEKATKINERNESIVEDSSREAAIPSSILEKGIIYFFFRPRVNTEDPKSVSDVARSHIVLRPIPLSTKLGEGPLEDLGNSRLIAVPKKMLPSSPKDRFLSFVENKGASIKELRGMFQGSEYATKTKGTSNQPPEQPFAEGVYALTSTGRESHLAYIITIPSSIGELQDSLGLSQKGSFIISVKNPTVSGPANANLSNPAKYPKEIMDKFNGRRWLPLEPEFLNYNHTQILLIGERKGVLGRAVEEQEEDKRDEEKIKPEEEMEKLEEEDEKRAKGLDEGDPVFADLGLSAKEFEKIRKSW